MGREGRGIKAFFPLEIDAPRTVVSGARPAVPRIYVYRTVWPGTAQTRPFFIYLFSFIFIRFPPKESTENIIRYRLLRSSRPRVPPKRVTTNASRDGNERVYT